VVGIIVGYAAAHHGPGTLAGDETMVVAAIEAELPNVLERQVSGTVVPFGEFLSGVSGTLEPVRTFKNVDGSFCRTYEAHIEAPSGDTMVSRGVACRDEGGRWHTRLQVNDA
jgi:surface antigen